MTDKRKYSLDEKVFDTITPESAYWIGFLYGDGNCTNENKIRIQIQWSDFGHLVKFRNFIKSDRPIKEVMTDYCHNASIEFRSWRVHHAVRKYDLTKRKEHRGRIHVDLLQKDARRNFIRGLFDADGSFYFGGNHKNWLYSEITGRMPVLQDVKNCLVADEIIDAGKKIVKNGSVFRIRFAKDDTVRLIAYLYGDKPPYVLARKYGMAKGYLDRLNETARKSEAKVDHKYHRPVHMFNDGKQSEFAERTPFKEPSDCTCCGSHK